ncbi:hypothetical protein DFQ14_101454 [Halopolyspora algeriensis]|uniref:Uncharacterized protein n=1 Tax=Halopolyspora algeriensis TaxID=1500506 RepID=A0A368W4Z0_9ACTN|nr:hypothetical protein DFQ14_101454 [Halopolyspora algeriensis]
MGPAPGEFHARVCGYRRQEHRIPEWTGVFGHGFESEWESEAVSKATTDPDTPIFGELHQELELPEIDVHDFEAHDFGFPKDLSAFEGTETGEAVSSAEATSEEGAAAGEDTEASTAASTPSATSTAQEESSGETSGTQTPSRGGRRRRED